MFERVRDRGARPAVSAWGVGGAGGRAVAQLIAGGAVALDAVVSDGDARVLQGAPARSRVRLMVCAPSPDAGLCPGEAAARASADAIAARLRDAEICLIAAGLGGATASGAAPVIAAMARARGIPTLAIVTTPIHLEGPERMLAAQRAVSALGEAADHLLVLPLQAALDGARDGAAFRAALGGAEQLLHDALAHTADLLVRGGELRGPAAEVSLLIALTAVASRFGGEVRSRVAGVGRRPAPPAQRIAACYRTGCGPELRPVRRSA